MYKSGGLSSNCYHRQNKMQILEQQQINRERNKQKGANEAKIQQQMRRFKSQYSHVSSDLMKNKVVGKTTHESGHTVSVFINECNASLARAYTYNEGTLPVASNKLPKLGPLVRKVGPNTALSGSDRLVIRKNSNLVPCYLSKRNSEISKEKEQLRLIEKSVEERRKCPVGHRALQEGEKAKIVNDLRNRQQTLGLQLDKFPITRTSGAMALRKSHIEKELDEVEEAIKKMGVNKQLYIPIQ